MLQIWVHGSHYESCLVAVVVPNRNRLEVRLASGRRAQQRSANNFSAFCKALLPPAPPLRQHPVLPC